MSRPNPNRPATEPGWIERTMERVYPEGGDPTMGDTAQAAAGLLVERAVRDLCWGDMTYRCDTCEFEWRIAMALGVEGPATLRDLNLYVPSPFMVSCPAWVGTLSDGDPGSLRPCTGKMGHVEWSRDRQFPHPMLLPEEVPRFILPDSGQGCARLLLPEAALIYARKRGKP